eukprot:gb/GECG01004348.1/.p1 GENE.gb/GECG01004348.1/~~gb/GECG01004348.1/.p1  ORF type:complete len:201 (+),score=38.22 gb/GECG01004348.1/:1-603(+)
MAAATAKEDQRIAQETSDYMNTQGIEDLFEDLTKHLILWQPSDPLDALVQYLEKRKAVENGDQKDGEEDKDAPVSTEQKALDYLEEHKIEKLLEELCASAVYHQPEDVLQFLTDEIKRVQASPEKRDPTFFGETDLRGMYSLFDPTRKGHISKQQVETGLSNLGLTHTTVDNEGSHETGRYTEDDFVKIGMERLQVEKIL